jgi:hypothetical protein
MLTPSIPAPNENPAFRRGFAVQMKTRLALITALAAALLAAAVLTALPGLLGLLAGALLTATLLLSRLLLATLLVLRILVLL